METGYGSFQAEGRSNQTSGSLAGLVPGARSCPSKFRYAIQDERETEKEIEIDSRSIDVLMAQN
jgi:hypothetical protein